MVMMILNWLYVWKGWSNFDEKGMEGRCGRWGWWVGKGLVFCVLGILVFYYGFGWFIFDCWRKIYVGCVVRG